MTTDNLRADPDALPGAAHTEARELVDGLSRKSIPSVAVPEQTTQRRRIGLGRGLGDLIPNGEQSSVPTQLQPAAGQSPMIVRVAVIESAGGVTVEIEDGAGGIHSELVSGEGSVDDAVMNGVALIVDGSHGAQIDVTEVETAEGTVVMVTAARDDQRSVGAAFVEYGRPYAIARAGLSALLHL